MPQCARLSPKPRAGGRTYFLSAAGAAMPALAVLTHSERNFLRSLPCRPLASACLEHSSDSAECSFGAFLSVGAAAVVLASVLVSALAAGAAVWAKAVPVANSEATATMAKREAKVMVLHSSCGNCEGLGRSARLAERDMNKSERRDHYI